MSPRVSVWALVHVDHQGGQNGGVSGECVRGGLPASRGAGSLLAFALARSWGQGWLSSSSWEVRGKDSKLPP